MTCTEVGVKPFLCRNRLAFKINNRIYTDGVEILLFEVIQ